MNYTVVLQILGIVEQYGPKVLSVVEQFPDIAKKAADATSKLKSGNVAGAVVDFDGILADMGLGPAASSVVAKSLAGAKGMAPDAPNATV